MAKYEIGDAGYYRLGHRYWAGQTVDLPDDEKPSRTFFPLDAAAKAAFKKHFPDLKPHRSIVEEAKDDTPRTMSEVNRGRASDRELL